MCQDWTGIPSVPLTSWGPGASDLISLSLSFRGVTVMVMDIDREDYMPSCMEGPGMWQVCNKSDGHYHRDCPSPSHLETPSPHPPQQLLLLQGTLKLTKGAWSPGRPVVSPHRYHGGKRGCRDASLREGGGFLVQGGQGGVWPEPFTFAPTPVQGKGWSTAVSSAGFPGGGSSLPHL